MSGKESINHDDNSIEESTVAEPVKRDSPAIAKLIENPLIRYAIIYGAVFALIIHILFSITAPCDFLEGEWGAGDILTYVSTIALGVLAVWQNQKFKEENDKAQDRLERISIESNELNVIAQISEHEAKYIDILSAAFDELIDACGIETLSIILMDKSNDSQTISAALQRINHADKSLLEIAFAGYQLRDISIFPLIDKCTTLSQKASLVLVERMKNGTRNADALYEMTDFYLEITSEKGAYIATRRRALYRLLFEKLSLTEIRAQYIEAGGNYGENENGIC